MTSTDNHQEPNYFFRPHLCYILTDSHSLTCMHTHTDSHTERLK